MQLPPGNKSATDLNLNCFEDKIKLGTKINMSVQNDIYRNRRLSHPNCLNFDANKYTEGTGLSAIVLKLVPLFCTTV